MRQFAICYDVDFVSFQDANAALPYITEKGLGDNAEAFRCVYHER
jgi:hypothetical protein